MILPGRLRPGSRGPVVAVIGLAIAARLVPLPWVSGLVARGLEQGIATDSLTVYLPLGRAIAERGEFSVEAGHPTAAFVPLYPLMLAGLDRLGLFSAAGRMAAQALLGAVVLALLFVWVRRMAGERAALLATLLAAVVPDFAVYSYLDLSENLSMLFLLVALIMFDRAGREQDARWWASTGVGLGLAALAREFCLTLLVPLVALALSRDHSRRGWSRVGLMAALSIAVVLPWTARNYARFGEVILLTDKGPSNFYVGTQIGRYHPSDPRRHWSLDDPAQAAVAARLEEGLSAAGTRRERDRLYLEAAWQNLSSDPLGEAAFVIRKATFFWQANLGLRHRERLGMTAALALSEVLYWASLSGAALAAFTGNAPAGRFGAAWVLVGWTFLFHMLVGEAEPRYHFALLPAIFALAGCWLSRARVPIGPWRSSSRRLVGSAAASGP